MLPEDIVRGDLAATVSYRPQLQKPIAQGRNDKCACGSGKKYKNCCLIRYRRKNVVPRPKFAGATTAAPEVAAATARAAIAGAMRSAGMRAKFVYAYLTTGLFITELNRLVQSEADLARWDAAVDYYEKHGPVDELAV